MTTDHLLIWKVAAPGTRTRPGKVIAARLSKVQAEEMADTLRKDGAEVGRGRLTDYSGSQEAKR